MSDTEQQQTTRRKHLQALTDDYHRSRYGDYDDTYAEFAATYGLVWKGEDNKPDPNEEIITFPTPKYASLHSDETYGMVRVFEQLEDALTDQVPDGSDTLSVPEGVIDLDTGEPVDYVIVAMTKEQHRLWSETQ